MREKFTTFIFALILTIFFLLVMICPKDEQSSVQENRPLAEMPEISFQNIFFGEFGSEYETYLTDNVGFRSKFVKLGTAIEDARGIKRNVKDGGKGKIVNLPSGSQLALINGKIMEVYKKNPETLAEYIRVLNAYAEKFGKNMYLMLAPTQIEFDTSEYHTLADSEKETIDEVYASLNGFKTCNAYDMLKEHTDEYIYFRTDHHWTQRGAYYGYKSIMDAKGEESVPLEEMKVKKASGFLGYLYNQANVHEYSEHADDIEYFEQKKNYLFKARGKDADGKPVEYQGSIYNYTEGTVPTYGIFMGGDHSFVELDTDVRNGKTALIIKDSYANTVIPFLVNHYEKILVIDPRSFDSTVTKLSEEYEIDDIIFINYVLTTTLPGFVSYIDQIR